MRLIAAILITFFTRCVYLYPSDSIIQTNIKNVFNNSCIFGPKSMSMILYNSANLKGKNIGEQESCSNIDKSKPIIFMVHGFISYANTTIGYELATQFVQNGYTVFLLDWSVAACKDGIPLIKLLEYPQAVENTHAIGKLMADYVKNLIEECDYPLDSITFMGHSLGAHVSAFAAKILQNEDYGKIPLLIGLDPAEPLFGWKDCPDRFCYTDAIHVIAIHTSVLGIPYPVGDMDLEFNGGKVQPGCLAVDLSCSHSKAWYYGLEVARNCIYPGVLVEPSILLTYDRPPYPTANTTKCILINDKIFNIKPNEELREGSFYAFTDSKPPYCAKGSFNSCMSIIDN